MVFRKALAFAAVILVLTSLPQDLLAAEASEVVGNQAERAATKDVDDGGITVSIIGIIIGTFLAVASHGGKNVAVGPVTIAVDQTHLHVSDERDLVVTVPFSNGNINAWDVAGYLLTKISIDGRQVSSKFDILSGAVQDTRQFTIPIEAGELGTTSVVINVEARGQDAGILFDSYVSRFAMGTEQIGVLSPLGPLALSPPAGETFGHGLGVTHNLTLENHAAREVWVLDPNVNGTTQVFAKAAPGQDHGPSTTTQLMYGGVNHTGSHIDQTEPIGFLWGCSEYIIYLKSSTWKQTSSLNNGTDFCLLKGDSSAAAPPALKQAWVSPRVSTGCFRPEFVQLSDVAHNFDLSDITVSIVNHPGVGPIHDLITDSTGQFCWDNLNLAPFVDVYLNSDGNVPELQQQTFERVPLEALENGDPDLVMNYVEWLVPPIVGTLEASDGGELTARVFSRRPGFPDHPIGAVSSGAFTLGGNYMLEFNSYSSELVFVPEPPFNRTLSPATAVVVPFDPTFVEGMGIGTVSFNIAPRETAPNITMQGTFLSEDVQPIPGLVLEFHDGPTLIASATTNSNGYLQVTVPNGVAVVSAPNLEALDHEPLPPEVVDFGLNGMTVLDVGNRMMFRDPLLFADGFEGGNTSAWASVIP